jgi:plastocyanin
MQQTSTPSTTKPWLYMLAVGLLVLLAACGGTTTTTTTSTPTTAPATPTTVPTSAPTTAPASTPTTAPSSSGNSVTIMNFSFNPKSLTVKVGTKVTWTNQDSVTHTVTADQGAFNSTVPSGNSFSFTFTKAGTYAYHCMIHPSMTATIVVQ